MTMHRISKRNLENALSLWSRHMEVYVPAEVDGEVNLEHWPEHALTTDYINVTLPIKQYLFEQKEDLFFWKRNEKEYITSFAEAKNRDTLLFGIRACDTNAVAYLDRFYLEEFRDLNYEARRKRIWIVALDCEHAGDGCFCSSTRTGPISEQGFDLCLTSIPGQDFYLVRTGTEKGRKLLELLGALAEPLQDDAEGVSALLAAQAQVEATFSKKIDLSDIDAVLDASFDHPIWKKLALTCINCTGCTMVCPSCTCFNCVEERENSNSGKRVRYWDSCQADSFTRNAGEHNPRDMVARFRYRMYDKLKYVPDRFGFKGCTGCGRCIAVCPTLISIADIASTLVADYRALPPEQKKAKPHASTYVKENRPVMAGNYLPHIAVIKDIIDDTPDIKRFVLEYEDTSLHENFQFGGQFFMITVFGVGEIAISIPFGPSQKGWFDFCVKKAGKVTKALHAMKAGDRVGLRGPYGKGFPYEQFVGKDVLFVGSGVGLAPVRTMIVRVMENRTAFGKICIIASATTYEGLVYKEDLIAWADVPGVKVLYALSKPTEKVDAHVGYINDLLPSLGFDWTNSKAILCASPRRIKAVAKDLMQLGMMSDDIFTSLETHMRCGIGKCGHCKVGSHYMCVDGPVFTYTDMLKLPPEF